MGVVKQPLFQCIYQGLVLHWDEGWSPQQSFIGVSWVMLPHLCSITWLPHPAHPPPYDGFLQRFWWYFPHNGSPVGVFRFLKSIGYLPTASTLAGLSGFTGFGAFVGINGGPLFRNLPAAAGACGMCAISPLPWYWYGLKLGTAWKMFIFICVRMVSTF